MADETINQQTEDTSPTSDDFLLEWDTASGTTKKVSHSTVKDLYWANPYRISVYRNAALAAVADVAIIFDVENFDSNSNYNVANGRFTVTEPGAYQIQANVSSQATPTSYFMAAIYKNGALWKYGSTADITGSAPQSSVADCMDLIAGDYITIVSHAGSTANLNVGQQFTYFSCYLIAKT